MISTSRTFLLTTSLLLILSLLSYPVLTLNLSIINKSTAKQSSTDLTYCSFNVQVFGQKKMQNNQVVDVLLKILSQCDLTLIMEIRDASGEAIKELLQLLSESKNSAGRKFQISLSLRLGRTSSKEQYGML
ncbi:predicted protein [Naegleria gruberi]|uniref:Predicted protein n=1 Tax=Naegleria gruberi TaxID=5762 RepID=D2W6R5_NAEGR|nr:uncharacterized protein NAEGRDRAFT_77109 [Naegleria gruberi]EFC35237.1 predicted protein [Naegleria gruberi]|eukprot:XP_002667981.1 predicted protein [Naegleria gruberi strain NEG-M]